MIWPGFHRSGSIPSFGMAVEEPAEEIQVGKAVEFQAVGMLLRTEKWLVWEFYEKQFP